MIAFLIAGILATQPLMATGNERGVWFVRDAEPGTLGPRHELCFLLDQDKYQVVLPLSNRPTALAIHNQTLWFVGDSQHPVLYRARLIENQTTGDLQTVPSGKATAVTSLPIVGEIQDIVFLDTEPIVVVEHEGTQCVGIDGVPITPRLVGGGWHITVLGDALVAVMSDETNTIVRVFEDGAWKETGRYNIEGRVHDFIVHDAWPILVTTKDNAIQLVGLQQNESVNIASFPNISGRWAVVAGGGLHAIGVERNGTITAFDIGWPSGTTSETIVLVEQHKSIAALEIVLLVATTCMFFIMMLSIFKAKPKKSNKIDSKTPP